MSVYLLPLLCVLVGWSAAFPEVTMHHTEELDLTPNVILPEATMGYTEELDLTANVIFNQIAIHQLQEEQRGVQEGVRSMLMVIANMTEGVKERENATRRLLDTLDQLEWVNKAHQADNLKLEEENTRLNTAIHLLEEDNRKTKNEVQLAQEEIVLLKSQIRQVEEDSRLVKEDNIKTKNEVRLAQEENIQLKSQIRQVEEDSRLVKEEIILVEEENRKTKNDVRLSQEENRLVRAELRQVEEDARQVKERIRELELAETQAQDMNNAAKTRVAELEREIKLLQETNNKTEGEKRHVEDQLSLLEKEKRDVEDQLSLLEKEKRDVDSQLLLLEEQVMVLQTSIAALEEDKEGQAQKINRVESEKNRTEVKSRLMEEEHQECKRNVTELSARLLSARDCAELYCKGARQDGVYLIIPGRNGRLVSAWCDMTTDGGGWTVFLQRDTRVVPAVNFTRDWEAYRTGFGNVSTEYWLGTEALHQLTQPSRQTLHLAAYNEIGLWRSWHIEHSWARWGIFSINSESTQYQLLVDWYQEDSTMGDVLVRNDNHSGMKFSTIDRDNDLWEGESCAQYHQGGGWWYSSFSAIKPS
nr:angiopoietin-related protein 6-like [Procambarus clarkii]